MPSSNETFIYKAMDPQAGYRKLNKHGHLKTQVKNTNYVIHLTRVSNRNEKMITIDCLFFDKNAWKQDSVRFSLCETGWQLAHTKEILENYQPVSTETANKYKDQFNTAINKGISEYFKKDLILDEKYRIIPDIGLQTTCQLYTGYHGTYHRIQLTGDIEQAITCDLTGEFFKEPVIMLEKMENIMGPDRKKYTLREGKSYEKSALEKAKVPCNSYKSNETLKQIVDKISPLSQMELSSLTDEHLVDPISEYDESNKNVCYFMEAWPRFKGYLQEHLKNGIEIELNEKDLKRKRVDEQVEDDGRIFKQPCIKEHVDI